MGAQSRRKIYEFNGIDIERRIRDMTGGVKAPFTKGGVYNYINFYLIDEAEHIPLTKR